VFSVNTLLWASLTCQSENSGRIEYKSVFTYRHTSQRSDVDTSGPVMIETLAQTFSNCGLRARFDTNAQPRIVSNLNIRGVDVQPRVLGQTPDCLRSDLLYPSHIPSSHCFMPKFDEDSLDKRCDFC